MKKPGVKIAFSVACLAAALALAVFTVFAWFTTNRRADTDGITSQTTSGDVDLKVTCYQMKSIENIVENDIITGLKYTWEKELTVNEQTNGEPKMVPYTPRVNNNISVSTAVVLEIVVTFNTSGKYQLNASSTIANNAAFVVDGTFNKDDNIWYNYLSNAVVIFELGENTKQVKEISTNVLSPTLYSFYDKEITDFTESKISTIPLKKDIEVTAPENHYHYYYFVMDYSVEPINQLYTYLTKSNVDANLHTNISFSDDIYFTVGK